MMKTSEIMNSQAATITPEDTMQHAAEVFLQSSAETLPVVRSDESGAPVGVLTATDFVRCVSEGTSPAACAVAQYMRNDAMIVNKDDSMKAVVDAARREPEAPSVIVTDGNKTVGVIDSVDDAADIALVDQSPILGDEERTENLILTWRCLSCGHLGSRDKALPDKCPDCGASKENFVLIEED